MKSVILALSMAAALVGCGSDNSSSVSSARASGDQLVLLPLSSARIARVDHITLPFAGPNGALGGMPQTQVVVELSVPCYAKLESFSYNTQEKNGKLVVYTQALTSQSLNLGMVCEAFSLVEKTVFVNKSINEKDISLEQLTNGGHVTLADDYMGTSPAKSIKVVGTHALCPEDVTCIANGTVIDLEVTKDSCVDELGPISYSFKEGHRFFDLQVAAPVLHSRKQLVAFCSQGPYVEKTSLTLINVYATGKKVNLLEVNTKAF